MNRLPAIIVMVLVMPIFLVSCGGHAKKKASIDECALIQDAKEKLQCYRSDIYYQLRSQLRADLLSWIQSQSKLDPDKSDINYELGSQVRADLLTWIKSQRDLGPPLLSGVRTRVDLDDEGGVKKVTLLNSSGNGGFDAVFIQSVYNSGPFRLPENIPENKIMRHRLQQLSWEIR